MTIVLCARICAHFYIRLINEAHCVLPKSNKSTTIAMLLKNAQPTSPPDSSTGNTQVAFSTPDTKGKVLGVKNLRASGILMSQTFHQIQHNEKQKTNNNFTELQRDANHFAELSTKLVEILYKHLKSYSCRNPSNFKITKMCQILIFGWWQLIYSCLCKESD